MNQTTSGRYTAILKDELVLALGCTEPIAIAYACALARGCLGREAESMTVACSGNILKNVRSVVVPHSGGRKGVEIAAILGMLAGDPELGLEVLRKVTEEDRARAAELRGRGMCRCTLLDSGRTLHILATLRAGADVVSVETHTAHTHVARVVRNGEVLAEREDPGGGEGVDKSTLNVRDILAYADGVELAEVEAVIRRQIEINSAISEEGLRRGCGAGIGRLLLRRGGAGDCRVRAKAAAAAGSDARMSGCGMPVVINSGSGNQGITASMPVVEYAKEMGAGEDRLIRALVVSNLIAVLQKRCLGSLSAFCGAVCAAVGAACGVAYLNGDGYDVVAGTITNALATIGGMVCDGAKPSCAAKIAQAVDTALLGYDMARNGVVFQPGDGLVKGDVEQTIAGFGRMGREGMRRTDEEILGIMLEG